MNVLLCPLSDPGFRYPTVAVGLELQRRGHDVSSLGPDTAPCPLPSMCPSEPRAFQAATWYRYGLEQFHAVVRAARVVRADVLVTSLLCHGALVAAEVLDIPVVVLGLAAHLWPYPHGGEAEPENPAQREWRLRETHQNLVRLRELIGLPARAYQSPERPLSGSTLLLRGHPDFEFPGARLPEGVLHVGPCWWEPAPDGARLRAIRSALDRGGKPWVYVHLGRTFGESGLWPWLNETFTAGPFQAVVELGRSGAAQKSDGADIVVVREPWMTPLVQRAAAVITNGTAAPVLAALLADRPLLLGPEGGEQHILASGCVRAGVGVPIPEAGAAQGSAAIAAALRDGALLEQVGRVGEWLRQSKSETAAADLVESATTVL